MTTRIADDFTDIAKRLKAQQGELIPFGDPRLATEKGTVAWHVLSHEDGTKQRRLIRSLGTAYSFNGKQVWVQTGAPVLSTDLLDFQYKESHLIPPGHPRLVNSNGSVGWFKLENYPHSNKLMRSTKNESTEGSFLGALVWVRTEDPVSEIDLEHFEADEIR